MVNFSPIANLSKDSRKLIYLIITRPNISHAVNLVSQFMHAVITNHMLIVKRILQYLKGSIEHGLLMKNNDHTQVLGYINVDWAGNTLDRKLTTDIVYLLGKIWFHGKVKNNWLLLASAQK
jgi:hypothetical protein